MRESRRQRVGLTGFRAGWILCCAALVACASAAPQPELSSQSLAPRSAAEAAETRTPDVLVAPRVERLSAAGWVEVRAAVLGSEDEAPASARGRAIARARQAAVEFVAGVRVKSSLVSLDQIRDDREGSLLQVLSASRADALVLDEVLESTHVSMLASGGYRVDITLRAKILDHGRDRDDQFRTEVRLNRKQFRDGEEVELSVRASEDARLYVLAISEDGAVMLIPSRHLQDTRIEANTWLHFPDARSRERGLHLRAALPDGETHAEEALIVIALRGGQRLVAPVPASGASFATASRGKEGAMLNALLAPLVHIPARDWTFDQLVYGIQPR